MSRGSKTGTRSVFATRKVRKRDGGASDDESDGDGDGDAAARVDVDVDVDARHRGRCPALDVDAPPPREAGGAPYRAAVEHASARISARGHVIVRERKGTDGGERTTFGAIASADEVRSMQTFFTHHSVSTFDRVPFQVDRCTFSLQKCFHYLLSSSIDRLPLRREVVPDVVRLERVEPVQRCRAYHPRDLMMPPQLLRIPHPLVH